MTTGIGTVKTLKFLRNLKQLPPERKAYWLSQLKTLKSSSVEWGEAPVAERDMLLDFANWLEQNSIANWVKTQDIDLAIANRVDKVYTAVADEVAKMPGKVGKGIGDLTGTGDYWPFVVGAAAALGAVYYLTQVSPLRR